MRHSFLLSLAALLALTMCGTADQPDSAGSKQASPGNTLIKVGASRAPDSLNPYLSTSLMGEIVAYRLFPTLFREEARFDHGVPALTPYLVADHAWDENKTTLTISLREGLTWDDGTPLTTADIAYSFTLQTDAEVAWLGRENKAGIDNWHVQSDTSMTVNFKGRSPFNLLNLNEGFIVPKHVFEAVPIAEWQNYDWQKNLVTFGPYRIGDGSSEERLMLQGIDDTAPPLAIAFIREKETLYQLLSTGELDYAWQLPVDRIDDIRTNLQPHIFPNKMLGFIAWNPIDPLAFAETEPTDKAAVELLKAQRPHAVLADKRVRQALNYGMRRSAYNQRFWFGESHVPATPWQVGLPFSQTNRQARETDMTKAAALLEEAGWQMQGDVRMKDGKPLKISVVTNLGSSIRENYLLAIQADLKQLGIDFQVATQEPSRYFNNMMAHQYDGIIAVIRMPTRPDLRAILHSESIFGGGNLAAWAAGDQQLDAIRDAETMAEIDQNIAQLEEMFFDDVPMTLLYTGQSVGASSTNIQPTPNYVDPLAGIEHWQP